MKRVICFFLVLPSILFAQWVQVGSDIYGDPGDAFGPNYINMNSQGNRIAVAAPLSDNGAPNAGHVRVYELIKDEWVQLGSDIQGNVYPGERFGSSISMSGDGNLIGIGTLESGVGSGKASVYEYNGTNWIIIGIIDGESSGDDLGTAISLSEDGLTMAVSAPGDDGNGTSSGLVQIYSYYSGSWVQIGQDIFGNQGDELGNSISLNQSGDIIAIGSLRAETINGFYSGKVRIYQNQNDSWIQLGVDINGSEANDGLGISIDLNSSGFRFAVGILGTDDVGQDNKGSVKVYEFDGVNWNIMGNEIIGDIRSNAFGHSLGLNDDGDIMVVGSPFSDPNNPYEGEAKFFKYNGLNWIQNGPSLIGNELHDNLGFSTCISANGNTIGVASPGNDMNGVHSGKVSVFNTESLLGISAPLLSYITIMPNPSKNKVFIESPNEMISELILYNSFGQKIQHFYFENGENFITLNINQITNGIYLAKIFMHNGSLSIKRIIKE